MRQPNCGAIILLCSTTTAAAHAAGQLEIRAIDRDSGQPLAVRMHLKNAQGKPVKPPGAPALGDHFVFYDKIVLKLPNGGYEFLMERGPEYLDQKGHFTIENFADDTKTVEMKRFVDMAKEGWYSGDLDVARPEKDLQLLMQADDLHVVALVTWSNKKNLWAKQALPKTPVNQFGGDFFDSLLGGEIATPGNILRVFRMEMPLTFPGDGQSSDGLGSLPFIPIVTQARREQHVWIDAGAFFARDLPIWIAAGQIDSVQLANRHLERDGAVDNEAGGWPRDTALFPKPFGNGRWSQEIYYHLLDCGLRMPPTAGSGSGVNNNPVGYNRVYANVAAAEQLSWDKWWDALRAGRVVVTNGPLIRPNVEGELPGHVFRADAGQTVELLIALTLSTRDKIRYLEIVKNGRSELEASLDDFKSAGGKLPPLRFTESGWFVIRAVTDNANTYRYATTAPYYVEIGYQPRISRRSVRFFLDWTNARAAEMAKSSDHSESSAAQTARKCIEQSQAYWKALLEKANVD